MRALFMIAISVVLLFSCSRKEPLVANHIGPLRYSVACGNLAMYDSTETVFSVYFQYLSGNMDSCRFVSYLSQVPAWLNYADDTQRFQLTDRGAYLRFPMTPSCGAYINDTMYFNVITDLYGWQQIPIALSILPPPDGAPTLIGNYKSNDPCGHFGYGAWWSGSYTSHVDIIPDTPY